MSNIYFTVTGLYHYYGDSFLEKEMIGSPKNLLNF